MRVLAGARSARKAWSGDLVVLRPPTETMDGSAEHLQLPLQSLIEKAMQGGWVGGFQMKQIKFGSRLGAKRPPRK